MYVVRPINYVFIKLCFFIHLAIYFLSCASYRKQHMLEAEVARLTTEVNNLKGLLALGAHVVDVNDPITALISPLISKTQEVDDFVATLNDKDYRRRVVSCLIS